ncbi:hypothetical protein SAMN05421504_106466 [Amycolatopsis xylanica]|uniref:LPXTG-motif cell wall anchor domain-containing protein n=1 Tax=Amycolatopsis xylanica TaxID=589385 RepID=A0A1H3M2F8_9PSEU|nr:hypothetical protein [Amycolatopsis xylanica]SDY70891.1 hypothetical protein SAMN05421504_106466 [Amycolatopsis xylanica]
MRKSIVAAGLAAGFALLGPAAAFAAEAPTTDKTTTPTTTEQAPTPEEHAGVPKAYLKVLPKAAKPGQKVTVSVGCDTELNLGSPALDIGRTHPVGPQHDPSIAPEQQASAVVKDVKPGTYTVAYECGRGTVIKTKFTVLPADKAKEPAKQVTKVPAGAPQTGGSDGPADYTALVVGLTGAGVLAAAGGVGYAAYRRRGAKN